MNIDIHVYQMRDGQWAARMECAEGKITVNPCANIEALMLHIKRNLLLKDWAE